MEDIARDWTNECNKFRKTALLPRLKKLKQRWDLVKRLHLDAIASHCAVEVP